MHPTLKKQTECQCCPTCHCSPRLNAQRQRRTISSRPGSCVETPHYATVTRPSRVTSQRDLWRCYSCAAPAAQSFRPGQRAPTAGEEGEKMRRRRKGLPHRRKVRSNSGERFSKVRSSFTQPANQTTCWDETCLPSEWSFRHSASSSSGAEGCLVQKVDDSGWKRHVSACRPRRHRVRRLRTPRAPDQVAV